MPPLNHSWLENVGFSLASTGSCAPLLTPSGSLPCAKACDDSPKKNLGFLRLGDGVGVPAFLLAKDTFTAKFEMILHTALFGRTVRRSHARRGKGSLALDSLPPYKEVESILLK